MTSNVDLTRKVYDAFNRGDLPAVLGAMDDNIRWEEPESVPYGSHTGPESVAEKVFQPVVQHLEGFSVQPGEWVDGGNTVVVLGRYRGRGSVTGKELDTPFIHVWRFTEGKVSGFRTSFDTYHWLQVIGSSPDAARS
jgi:uncharacterized protein